jgi:hypothetical protein
MPPPRRPRPLARRAARGVDDRESERLVGRHRAVARTVVAADDAGDADAIVVGSLPHESPFFFQ